MTWANTVWGYLKTSELNTFLTEDEFLWVESDAIPTAKVQPLHCLEEAMLDCVCPKENIVDAFSLVLDVGHDRIVTSSVPIARCNITLWSRLIPVSASWCNECGKVLIIRM